MIRGLGRYSGRVKLKWQILNFAFYRKHCLFSSSRYSGDTESFLQSTEISRLLGDGGISSGDWVDMQVEDFVEFQLWNDKENK